MIDGAGWVYLLQGDPWDDIVAVRDEGPGSNTDRSIATHGTGVAGLIGATGTTDPAQVGVAPEAEVIGYAVGQDFYVAFALTALDHILAHPELGIDVVDNSYTWGPSWDPAHPLAVATKELV